MKDLSLGDQIKADLRQVRLEQTEQDRLRHVVESTARAELHASMEEKASLETTQDRLAAAALLSDTSVRALIGMSANRLSGNQAYFNCKRSTQPSSATTIQRKVGTMHLRRS